MAKKTRGTKGLEEGFSPITGNMAVTAAPIEAEDLLKDFFPQHRTTPDEAHPKTIKSSKTSLKDKLHHEGHRERLRARFVSAGDTALPDYELLELMLFRALPRRDVKPLAKLLIKTFGSFAEVLAAPILLLKQVEGMGESAAIEIKIYEAAARRFAKNRIHKKEVLASWQGVLEYCRTAMAYEVKEQFRLLFLDKRNQLIADEVQQVGTIDHTPVYPREIVKRALELSASAIILVHNHPSGDPTPSLADIKMTHQIIAVTKPLGVEVLDHIIIGKNGHASLKALGHM